MRDLLMNFLNIDFLNNSFFLKIIQFIQFLIKIINYITYFLYIIKFLRYNFDFIN